MQMVLAMIKEPTATNACLEQFQKLPDTTDGEQFAKALTNLAVHMSRKQCQLELASLSGRGSVGLEAKQEHEQHQHQHQHQQQ